jgi:cytidyltransferase-like protein
MKKERLIMVSGGFDPLHIGHLEMFKEAKELGDKLLVVLNCDNWLIRKKGRFFMNQRDRADIIKSIRYVDEVYVLQTGRDDVGEAIEKFRPAVFANGGDRKDEASIPEAEICRKLGVEMIFNVGKSGKIRSSSELLKNYNKKINII